MSYNYLRFDRPFRTEYGPNLLFTFGSYWGSASRRPGTGQFARWPQAGWELSFPIRILVCRVASNPPFTPGICRQFLQVAQQWERAMPRGPGSGIVRHAGVPSPNTIKR